MEKTAEDQRRSSSNWAGISLCVLALLAVASSPFLKIYLINWRLALFVTPLSAVFFGILIIKSGRNRIHYWWAYLMGIAALFISGGTLFWAWLMGGLFGGL